MAKNIELVRQEVAAMRNEVEDFANSAERVGGVVSDVLEYGHEQLTDGKNKHEALAERVTVAEGTISAEVARAQAAEGNLLQIVVRHQGDIDGIKPNLESAVNGMLENYAAIADEVQARSEAVADLEANIGISEYPVFDPAKDYAVGDVVVYEGLLKRFVAEHTAGEWNAEQVESWSERKEVDRHFIYGSNKGFYLVSNDYVSFRKNEGFLSKKISVAEGDIYYISSKGSGAAKSYIITDINGKVIRDSGSNSIDGEIEIQENESILFVSHNITYNNFYIKKINVADNISELYDKSREIEKQINYIDDVNNNINDLVSSNFVYVDYDVSNVYKESAKIDKQYGVLLGNAYRNYKYEIIEVEANTLIKIKSTSYTTGGEFCRCAVFDDINDFVAGYYPKMLVMGDEDKEISVKYDVKKYVAILVVNSTRTVKISYKYQDNIISINERFNYSPKIGYVTKSLVYHNDENFYHVKCYVKKGDCYIISARGSGYGETIKIFDSFGLLKKEINGELIDYHLTIEDDGILVVNHNIGNTYMEFYVKYVNILNSIERNKDAIVELGKTFEISSGSGFYIKNSIDGILSYRSDTNFVNYKVYGNAGDTFIINGQGTGVAYTYIVANIDNTVTRTSDTSVAKDVEITLEDEECILVVNHKISYNIKHGIVYKGLANAVSKHKEGLDKLVNSTLYGKTILCLGDSITEMTDAVGKGYSHELSKLSQAKVINGGVGGSHIERIRDLVYSLDEYKDQWSGYDWLSIISICEQLKNGDFSNSLIAANYLNELVGDDNINTVNRLASVNIQEVDIVTIFAGTNGYSSATNKGSTDINDFDDKKQLSALNLSIRTLLEANPNLSIFVFTPIPRYGDTNSSELNAGYKPETEGWEWDDAYFSDNFANGIMKELVQGIQVVCKNNHIPCCDMYNTTGINKYSFSGWFSHGDGVHPKKGLKRLGKKIYSFIMANRYEQ